jgi:hypothetical protein
VQAHVTPHDHAALCGVTDEGAYALRYQKERENLVEGFEWAENNLGVQTPHQLQDRGVNVFFAPMITPNEKVVNLANGRIERFLEDEPRPGAGYYAEYASLERFCLANNLPLTETDGQASVLPIGFEQAGNPLERGGE